MTDLENKTALVTGASRGIGAAIAVALAKAGARVTGTVNTSSEQARALQQEHGIKFISVDLSRPDAADTIASAYQGSLDILVNNAGIASFIGWGENNAETIDREFAINVRVPLLLSQALDSRINDNGRLIFLSSVVAKRAFADGALAAYASTKGAVDTLVKQLAGPFGTRGITVNAVAPGAIDTDMSAWLREEGGEAQAHQIQALKRVGKADDVASVVAFLASDAGRWISGQTLQAGGGTLV
jgi:NAD(P)-dependent dehydrogenase (short-subunit alcohol dehydrogenase family)